MKWLKKLGIVARYSLEKKSVATADAFSTVSYITANEAEKLLGKKVDVVTPNAFSTSLFQNEETYSKKKKHCQSENDTSSGGSF